MSQATRNVGAPQSWTGRGLLFFTRLRLAPAHARLATPSRRHRPSDPFRAARTAARTRFCEARPALRRACRPAGTRSRARETFCADQPAARRQTDRPWEPPLTTSPTRSGRFARMSNTRSRTYSTLKYRSADSQRITRTPGICWFSGCLSRSAKCVVPGTRASSILSARS